MVALPELVPDCKVRVQGKLLDTDVDCLLTRVQVDFDAQLFAECRLLFTDPARKLIAGSLFECGAPVEVALGNVVRVESVFSGEVVRLEPQFQRNHPAALLVVCYEALHRLALSQLTRTLDQADTADVVAAIAHERGLDFESPSSSRERFFQANQTDAAVLRRLGSQHGLQVRLEGKRLVLGAPASLEPVKLEAGRGLRSLKVRLSEGAPRGVEVHGWDPGAKREFCGKASAAGGEQPGSSAGAGYQQVDNGGRSLPPDLATAEKMAAGRLRKLAERRAVAQGEAKGDPRLVPGQTVELGGSTAAAQGTYRIERATHEFSRSGYRVDFKACRISGKKKPAAPPRPPELAEPAPRPKPLPALINVRWKRRESEDVADLAGDLNLRGYDGRAVEFVLETQAGGGSWKEVARSQTTVQADRASASARLAPLPAAKALGVPRWEKGGGAVSVEAPGLDGCEVRLLLERLAAGEWQPVEARLVRVQGGKAQATFPVEHPADAAQKPAAQTLSAPRWQVQPGDNSGKGWLEVLAPDLPDGQRVRLLVERLGRDGKWLPEQTVTAPVQAGRVHQPIDLSHHRGRDNDAAQLSKPVWSNREPGHGEQGSFKVEAPGLDGRRVRFVIERLEGGRWEPAGESLATVKGGTAESAARLSHPEAGSTARELPGARFAPETGVASVPAEGLDRRTVQLQLERRAGRGWVAAGTALATAKGGEAAVRLARPAGSAAPQPPAFRVSARLLPDTSPRRLRYRAELLPDLGAQRLRFRAEPLPDLAPARLRFRAEVPLPSDPALTRVRARLLDPRP